MLATLRVSHSLIEDAFKSGNTFLFLIEMHTFLAINIA